ncbi:putative lipid II flippase FtsW [Saliterribacillus persicus]|uniref:Probable peptidoglycan glycosyltransferase FtsW n=1 Tax=Saliterribacillus persicus TaxID=930114 RepID=A0A368XSH8_9BACI|nr:putative lipid II flippase FtsW [Saliterribacillus persicus]RCW70835.1 cell division-specific peptidoglycan biosynthesis regulator FtsW [Saliterribacillus persicus]
MKQTWKTFDFTLLFTPLILSLFGIAMIYSASMVSSVIAGNPAYHLMSRQLLWFGIGLVAFVFTSLFNYHFYQKIIKFIIVILIILLFSVLFFGSTLNNSTSWILIGPFSVQPSEFVKLGLIIYLAAIYSKKQGYIDDFLKGVLPPLIITGLLLALIIRQPDIGTAAIIFLIASSVILSSGIKWKHLSVLIIIGVIVLVVGGMQMITDERISRFTGAYEPFSDPDDGGYQLIQSYIAMGTGGITGEGIGQGIQKLGYLTQPESDFIMAVIAEELGFIGVLLVIGAIALIVLRGLYISRKCKNNFGSLLAIGISSMIGIQAMINLGAISGLLPITGVPLPFISYGGSSLMVMLIGTGILNNIARHVKHEMIYDESYEVDVKEEERNVNNHPVRNFNRQKRSTRG